MWSDKDTEHPLWRFAHVLLICTTLLLLQLMTANSYDLALDGEAGAFVGVSLMVALSEFLRK